MDWTAPIDAYCERTDPTYWSEPVNALTNLAFLLAAWVLWRRVRGQGLPVAVALSAILALIGLGSFAFHTYAQAWSALADTGAIAIFTLVYVFAATRDFLGRGARVAALATVLFVPYALAAGWVFDRLPFFSISSFYWPIALMIALYGFGLLRSAPQTGAGLLLGAGILSLSIVFRSLDMAVCAGFPVGTHFLWHILNAVMLGWMVEVYRRHMLEGGRAGR